MSFSKGQFLGAMLVSGWGYILSLPITALAGVDTRCHLIGVNMKKNHLISPRISGTIRYLKWRYWTLSPAILRGGLFPHVSPIHAAYVGEDSSILGTWNAFWWLNPTGSIPCSYSSGPWRVLLHRSIDFRPCGFLLEENMNRPVSHEKKRGSLSMTAWWFQPIWKILVKLDHLPR